MKREARTRVDTFRGAAFFTRVSRAKIQNDTRDRVG